MSATTTAPTMHALVGWKQLKAYLAAVQDGALDRDAIALVGRSGTGKTSAARIIASALGTENPAGCFCGGDNVWLDAGTDGYIDEIRALKRTLQLSKAGGAWRVVVIDEAHALTAPAKRALLGMLEQLPQRTLFILTATSRDFLDFDRGALARRVREFWAPELTLSDMMIVARERFNGTIERLGKGDIESLIKSANGNLGRALKDIETASLTGEVPERARGKVVR